MTGFLDSVAVLAWNVFAFGLWALAAFQVIRTPAGTFEDGWRTKIARLLMIECLGITIAGLYLPFGPALVLVGLCRAARHTEGLDLAAPRGPQLPGCAWPPHTFGGIDDHR